MFSLFMYLFHVCINERSARFFLFSENICSLYVCVNILHVAALPPVLGTLQSELSKQATQRHF